jgi:oligoxyloglucan reducing-end-specific cellobiohydrolase
MKPALWISAAAATAICLYGQWQPEYVWQPVRIVAGGYIPGFVAHPTEPGLIYARTDIGSVYRWSPASAHWVPLTDFHSPSDYNLNGPESIALDPTDPDRLYIAAGMYACGGCPFAILSSRDRGATFTAYTVPFQMAANNDGRTTGERLAVNPFRPSEMMMGTRKSGLWKSEDYAQTWAQVSSFPVSASPDGFGVQWILFDAAHSGTIYAGVYTTSSIYQSTDGGATWAALPGQPIAWPYAVANGTHAPVPVRAVLNPDGNLYITFGDFPGPNNMNYGLVEKFNPADRTWTNITPPIDRQGGETAMRGGFCGISQDPSRQGTVAVSTLDRWYPVDTVYLTHDGGTTWIDLARTTSTAESAGAKDGNYYFDLPVFQPVSPWLSFGGTGTPKGTARFGWWMSALLIDPTNPNRLMYATGASVYSTDNLQAADGGKAPSWSVQGMGIEEVAITSLISPTAGAHLLSGMGDIGGFRHDDFTSSPRQGMFTNPVAITLGSLDWAGQSPQTVVRAALPNTTSTSPCNWGGISRDGGASWQPLPACAAGAATGTGGAIAIDAGGTGMVWTASGAASYSADGGVTWAAAPGLSGKFAVAADKVTPNVFYAYGSGAFYRGASSFQRVNAAALPTSGSCNGSGCGVPVANFAGAGDVWLPLGSNGLYHSTDGGSTWSRTNVTWANSVAVGAPANANAPQAVYLYGYAAPANVMAIYRSDDNGATWLRINDDTHQYGGPTLIQADPRVYGRVFLGMNGRGIIYGDLRLAPGRSRR